MGVLIRIPANVNSQSTKKKTKTDHCGREVERAPSNRRVVGSNPGRVEPKTLKSVLWYRKTISIMRLVPGQVCPVSVYCDRVGCLRTVLYSYFPVWQHLKLSSKHHL